MTREMIRNIVGVCAVAAVLTGIASGEDGWWMTPHRLIQTNLREIDVTLDVDSYVATVRDYAAGVVLINCGGIVANYPTELPFQYRNPRLQGDFIGEMVEKLHAAGIRVIIRFDFSKLNEAIGAEHPEWRSRGIDGEFFPAYNGQVPVCPTSWYQQEGMLQILGEAIDRYPVDGVFFNMIGFPQRDYSGRLLGPGLCDEGRRMFREQTGFAFADVAKPDHPAAAAYEAFTERVKAAQFEKVHDFIKAKRPDIAICTYTPSGIDVIRSESNTPHGHWLHEDLFRTRRVLVEFPGEKQSANAAVHFFHYPHRHAAVSPWLTQRRLVQQIVSGSWLDFYCIGHLDGQEDRTGLDQLRDVYCFHAANEPWLVPAVSNADVGLVIDGARDGDEVKGLFRILVGDHVSFDLVKVALDPEISRFRALVVPIVEPLSSLVTQRLDEYVANGGLLLLTGPVPEALECAGIVDSGDVVPYRTGSYWRVRPDDRVRFGREVLRKLDLVFHEGEYWPRTVGGDENALRLINDTMFGPPEKCYYTSVTDIPGFHARRHGRGAVTFFPWHIGTRFEQVGHQGHAALVLGALDSVLGLQRTITVKGPAQIEIHRRTVPGRGEWVSLFNLSGQMDGVMFQPLPIRGVEITLLPEKPVKAVRALKSGESLDWSTNEAGWVTCHVPEVGVYEFVAFEY